MPHIELVVQFMVPVSLSVWMQRAGRAGRAATLQARAILLVQPSIFQEKHTKSAGNDNEVLFVKMIDEGLRTWLETKMCRRDAADEYFHSGVKRRRTYVAFVIVRD